MVNWFCAVPGINRVEITTTSRKYDTQAGRSCVEMLQSMMPGCNLQGGSGRTRLGGGGFWLAMRCRLAYVKRSRAKLSNAGIQSESSANLVLTVRKISMLWSGNARRARV